MEEHDKKNITNILYRTVINTNLYFTSEEYLSMIIFIKDNPDFCSKWISDPKVRKHLKLKDKLTLLENFNVDILIKSNYFTYCSKTELTKVLKNVNNKKALKDIINQARISYINLNEIKDKDKKMYIESLLVAKKLSM